MKIGARVKCGFRGAGCEEVPMCQVPREVQGVTPQFADANTPRTSAAEGLGSISGRN